MATTTTARHVARHQEAAKPASGRPSLADRGLVRATFDIPREEADLLEETAKVSRFNKTTTFIRALRLLAELDRHARDGGQIILVAADGTKERLRIL